MKPDHFGIEIDHATMAAELGIPVVAVSAKRNHGIHQPLDQLHRLHNRRTRAVDRILLHPVAGLLLFLGLVLTVFQLLYLVTTPPQDRLGSGLDWVQAHLLEPGLYQIQAPPVLKGLVVDGLWLGGGTVATSAPLIFCLMSCWRSSRIPDISRGWPFSWMASCAGWGSMAERLCCR